MGGLNIKLMQGIDEAESRLQMEKQPQRTEKPDVAKEARTEKKNIQKSQTVKKQSEAKKGRASRKSHENASDNTEKKHVFSFRAKISEIAVWKAYAVATGQTVEMIGNNAMDEYLRRHKLAGAELAIFDALKAREEDGRK